MRATFSINDLEKKLKEGKIRGYSVGGKEVKKKSKYGNQKVVFDGRTFDSKKEMRRYIELRARLIKGEVQELECQVPYVLSIDETKVCTYIADFTYLENGQLVVEDVKSKATRKIATYRLKSKLMKAIHNIEIKET